MQKVRWGLLSTANINRRLIPAIQQSARGDLVAVASRSQAAANAYAAKWEITEAFGSYEAMLDSDQVDAVYISLPNSLHKEWTVKALKAGKHVLCEKPFALTLAAVDEMMETAAMTGKVLAEAFMYRHHPQTKIVQAWLQDGRLGDVVLVRSVFSFALSNQSNIRLRPEVGGGSLWDVGCYPMSFAQMVMGGPPKWVLAAQQLSETGVDISLAAQMQYEERRMAQISSSFRVPYHTAAEIIGTAGRLLLTRPFTGLDMPDRALTFFPADGAPQEIPVPDEYLYLGEVEDMHDAILEGKPPFLTLAETRNHVRTILALYESARSQSIVYLD